MNLVDGDLSGVDEAEEALERPRVDGLQEDLLPLGLHQIVGEHGVEVRAGGRENDPVSELRLVDNVVLLERGENELQGMMVNQKQCRCYKGPHLMT